MHACLKEYLEDRYQDLLRRFSEVYLQTSEWYVGDTLIPRTATYRHPAQVLLDSRFPPILQRMMQLWTRDYWAAAHARTAVRAR